ncbi:hypothetical protein COY95_02220, partial [Candidatus Woesearchaeota archaeon CG_4_10_14_0_8_um_filter_47_5]
GPIVLQFLSSFFNALGRFVANIMGILIIGLLIFALVYIGARSIMPAAQKEGVEKMSDLPGYVFTKAKTGLNNYVTVLQKTWQEQLDYATGRKHEGEEETKQKIWVELEDLKVYPKKKNDYFDVSDEITVLAPIKASILNVDESKKIFYTCSLEGGAVIKGPDPPENLLSDLEGSGEVVECAFSPHDTGTKTINVTAQFDFSTEGYTQIAFMDRELKKQKEIEGFDLVAEYNIASESTSIYSGGPLMVGIERFEAPYGVRPDGSTTSVIDFTFENTMDGQIIEMKDIVITLPSEITFEPGFAGCPLVQTGGDYHLNTAFLSQVVEFPLKRGDYFPLTCKMKIDRGIIGDISIPQIREI